MKDEIIYQLALSMVPGIGPVTATHLLKHFGQASNIFNASVDELQSVSGCGKAVMLAVKGFKDFHLADKELAFMQKWDIKCLFINDASYPQRLKQCHDAPVVLFTKGKLFTEHQRIIAVVGSRHMTSYGADRCRELIRELTPLNPLIISGLAYGVDACAHRAALEAGLPTAAILGHGLDRVYPAIHRKLAGNIIDNGFLMSEFPSGSTPGKDHFPRRNRIIAGLCDAVIVVEAALTGGALITANLANSYNRDVFAIPGRTTDKYSQGCNKLIRINKAHLLESAANISYIMNWDYDHPPKNKQQTLFVVLSEEEKQMVGFIRTQTNPSIDSIVRGTGLNLSACTSILLGLEFKGVVRPLPGKRFQLRTIDSQENMSLGLHQHP